MDVFLVPVGDTVYEVYYEPNEADEPRVGVTAYLLKRVRERGTAEEEARRHRRAARRAGKRGGAQSWLTRTRAGLIRVLAQWVAQQRMLWHLRHVDTTVLVYPDDLDASEAMLAARGWLQGSVEHHRFWMVVDGLGVAIIGPFFFFVPGPNLIAWDFFAKMAGHWLASSGARCGLSEVTWEEQSCHTLTEVRQALTLPAGARRPRLRALSGELHLGQLAAFIERRAG